MAKQSALEWHKVDVEQSGLEMDVEHNFKVKREAIPIVFVPGIMGSVLRRAGTNGEGDGADGLPNMRWNPSSKGFMFWRYSGKDGEYRRRMLIGPGPFDGDFLEVHNTNPIGNGFQGVAAGSYHGLLNFLQNQATWGPLSNIFDMPVYAVGYNWTDTSRNSGKMLATRIDEIIKEEKQRTGICEKVIVISHSMGGLVSRAASELAGAKSKILGIIHGVQPATGAAAAYWRMKAGFEGFGMVSRVLGNSGPNVTPILGNILGGLELLPNKNYRINDGGQQWLTVTEEGSILVNLPQSNPYEEIYRVEGTGNEVENPGRRYWGLIDPDLLNPGANPPPQTQNTNDPDALDGAMQVTEWEQYLEKINKVESFHDELGIRVHPQTYTFHGTDHTTADRIGLVTESVWVEKNPYPERGFRARFINEAGKSRRALLQNPSGTGDGTVSVSSATSLDGRAQLPPAPLGTPGEHEPIFKNDAARNFVVSAVAGICKKYYEEKRGKKIGG